MFRFLITLRWRLSNLWKWSGSYYLTKDGALITEPGEEYNIFTFPAVGVVSFLGFIDLSLLGAGDKVEITLKMSVREGHKVNRRIEFSGPLKEPIIDFPERNAINPIISIRQVTGVSRKIWYVWKWRKV